MKKNKDIVDIYPTIYGVDLVVARKSATLEDLKKDYMYYDGVELDDDVSSFTCSACKCKRKSDNRYCVVIKYNHPCSVKGIDKKADLVNTCAHEAGHAALFIYEYVEQNVCFCSQEPFCYLVGWVAECMYKTLQKK